MTTTSSHLDAALEALFEAQALSCTPAQDEAMLDAAIAAARAPVLNCEQRRLGAAIGYGFPVAA